NAASAAEALEQDDVVVDAAGNPHVRRVLRTLHRIGAGRIAETGPAEVRIVDLEDDELSLAHARLLVVAALYTLVARLENQRIAARRRVGAEQRHAVRQASAELLGGSGPDGDGAGDQPHELACHLRSPKNIAK